MYAHMQREHTCKLLERVRKQDGEVKTLHKSFKGILKELEDIRKDERELGQKILNAEAQAGEQAKKVYARATMTCPPVFTGPGPGPANATPYTFILVQQCVCVCVCVCVCFSCGLSAVRVVDRQLESRIS